jgi:nucleoside-diphosphate-sugar epimerase
MTIAVTGASGHLGSVLVPYLWERGYVVEPIGYDLPLNLDADVLLHLAAPDWRDEGAIRDFARFNEQVARWSEVTGGRVINTGTWWQYASPESAALSYSRLKDDQQAMFATTLVPFSIYGTTARSGRGFVPQLIAAARGTTTLTGASRQPRDWVHARDVCDAYRALLRAPEGIYEAATGVRYSPAELARSVLGTDLPDYPDVPPCLPRYRHPRPPGWVPRIDVIGHINRSLNREAA